jgi:hypothetical protein
MAGIAERMAGMGGGKRSGGGIAEAMSGRREPSMEREPESEEGGVGSHLKALHGEMGGKHMHVHAHEGGFTTHHVGEDGNVEGPHDHENIERLKEHMDQFLSEEEHEPSESEDRDGLM